MECVAGAGVPPELLFSSPSLAGLLSYGTVATYTNPALLGQAIATTALFIKAHTRADTLVCLH